MAARRRFSKEQKEVVRLVREVWSPMTPGRCTAIWCSRSVLAELDDCRLSQPREATRRTGAIPSFPVCVREEAALLSDVRFL